MDDDAIGRAYAACFVLVSVPFLRPFLGPSSTTTLLGACLAAIALVVGMVGLYDPDFLGFHREDPELVAVAVVGVAVGYSLWLF